MESQFFGKDLLLGYITGVNNNLPKNWDSIHDKEEKINYIDSILKVDKSNLCLWDLISGYKYPGTLCSNMVAQLITNFSGIANLDTLDITEFSYQYHDYSENGKWQIPVQYVGTTAQSGKITVAHAIGGVLVGDSATKFEDWSFIDAFQHTITKPGNWDMVDGKPIIIDYYYGISTEDGPPNKQSSSQKGTLRFEKINGKYIITYKNPSVVLTNPKFDSVPPLMGFSFKDTISNNPEKLILKYDFHDGDYMETILCSVYYNYDKKRFDTTYFDFYSGHFLDSGFYQIDGKSKNNFNFSQIRVPMSSSSDSIPIYFQSGDIPLDISEGKHKVVIEVSDYNGRYSKGNIARDTIQYTIDVTLPEIIASIIQKEVKDSAIISINTSDEHLKYSEFCFNDSEWETYYLDTIFEVKLKDGKNILKVRSYDLANNITSIVKTLKADFTSPQISFTGIKQDTIYQTSKISINVIVADENLKDFGYVFEEERTSLKPLNGKLELELQNGNYKIHFYANDSSGNETITEPINFSMDAEPIGIEKMDKEVKGGFYPNPFSEKTIYKYSPKQNEIILDIYNLYGIKIFVITDKNNNGIIELNLSNFTQGVYFYKDNYGNSGIIVKK